VSLFKWVEGIGIVAFLRNLVQKHPAEEYAKDMANELKKIVENEVGKDSAKVIRDIVLNFTDKFYTTFRNTLLRS